MIDGVGHVPQAGDKVGVNELFRPLTLPCNEDFSTATRPIWYPRLNVAIQRCVWLLRLLHYPV